MITTIIVNILVVFFAFLESSNRFRHGLKVSFFIIFLFLALRYNFGNDYRSYLGGFIEINRYDSIDYFAKYHRVEIGWIILNRLFKPIGFFAMIAFLALFSSIVYYRFIKKYVPLNYYWFAVFIYVFSPGFLLIHSSTMRQSIAIVLFIFSFEYLFKKDGIRFFLIIALAYLFHTSAIILFPVYFLSLFSKKANNTYGLVLVVGFILLFFLSNISFLEEIIFNNFSRYFNYYAKGKSIHMGSGIGIVFKFVLVVVLVYYKKYLSTKNNLIINISLIGFLFIPLSLLIFLVSRLGMYFAVATIAAYPIVIQHINNLVIKRIVTFSIIFMTLFSFYQFFQVEIWINAFGTYQTILSSSKFY